MRSLTLDVCVEATLAGGKAALGCESSVAELKKDNYVDGHAIVSEADYVSQRAILEVLKDRDPEALFMTEEECDSSLCINREADVGRLVDSRVYVIDEICGSSGHNVGHYEWNVSVGCVENLEAIAGAVFAPQVFGGALFYAEKGQGMFMTKGVNSLDFLKRDKVKVNETKVSDSYVIFGPDCVLSKYPRHQKLMNDVGDAVRTTNISGSCGLPLGLVASGSADALVQPLQCPWDYAAGKVMIEEAGGVIDFYEMDDRGDCFKIDELELKHYNPEKRNVGFIAGNREIVDFIGGKLFG